jgi:DNA-binding NarL/FixJ family response regulator
MPTDGIFMTRLRLFILVPHRLVREGLALLVERAEDIEVVGMDADLAEGLEACVLLHPDVLLLQADGFDGIEQAAGDFRRSSPDMEVVLISERDDPLPVNQAMEWGAAAVYLMTQPSEFLLERIRLAASGDAGPLVTALQPSATSEVDGAGTGLTPRELQVLRGISEGKSTAELAEELAISPQTVQSHVRSILAKLGVNSRIEAVITALRDGLVSIPQQA